MPVCSRTLAAIIAAMLLWGATAYGKGPAAVQGTLHLPVKPAESLPLEGEWGFAWARFVDPAWERLPTTAFARVPSNWNQLAADGKPAGEDGWGSYVLQVDCPRGQSLAVEAVGQRTASRLFINGEPVAVHGEPGPSPRASRAAVHAVIPLTREFPCPLRLTLHVSNFDHRGGGFVRPLLAGPVEVLEKDRVSRAVHAAVLLSAYVLTGLASLIFFAVRRRERVTLVFGLFCLALGVYTDMIGERLLLRPLAPEVRWGPYMQVEYLSYVAGTGLFFLTLRMLFPSEIHRNVVRTVLAVLGAEILAVLTLPPAIYSYTALPGAAVAVVVSAYCAVAMLRGSARTRVEARVLVVGIVAVLVTLVVDLLFIDTPRPDRKFAPFGFALFLLSPAVVIARRMSQALSAEERTRTLEENARLREDVERMSRHDLKTPLGSIHGAARLLREDPRLAQDQQELVAVVQRAALRMLEMVNLSLGLFRMQTGTYELRPRTVDLREVVALVMVDLHAQAQAGGVVVRVQDRGPAPVPARAEELLCYSIVANLLKNAIEASQPGEQVTIGFGRDDPVTVRIHNPAQVPPDIAARFFDMYVSGGKGGGTGLGTHSARLMARTQHGDLVMQTGPGGTALTLTLPASREAAPLPASPALPARTPWLETFAARDVLLVDDDEFTRLVTRRLLPTPPFHVRTEANGRAAMDAMTRQWPHYVLLDMEMPLQGGVETVRWLREQEATGQRPRCGVIMISGNDDAASAARALEAGADRFLLKPVSPETLFSAMRELEQAAALPSSTATAAASADDRVVVDRKWEDVLPRFLQAQREAVEAMGSALAAGDLAELEHLGHRAYGALSTMGLDWAADQSRTIQAAARAGGDTELKERIDALREHLANVQVDYR
jgi:two-component system, sensor histidine kinase ChiS